MRKYRELGEFGLLDQRAVAKNISMDFYRISGIQSRNLRVTAIVRTIRPRSGHLSIVLHLFKH
jgi:hypothetical protein